ncbi:hypothetical protein BT67DRAFT_391636 [Trichocladium antarcticum]|uniref:Uncharacterized protein n=1 Tax=Trichocladium antarcticum TaxID=1450529 RepID=A0AAN6ZAF9_9PEZI|nr:hypothetical protein BT67DRAFT_391636 [Trichocladium antarcticum]
MTDVTALVTQMQETLATIHATLASLDTAAQDSKLDGLEKTRDDAVGAIAAAFSAESEALAHGRRSEREEIAEQRRKEDAERERKRREEDAMLATRDRVEDEARDGKFKDETEQIERETDIWMNQVEEDARVALAGGYEKLRRLQERRRVSASGPPWRRKYHISE